MVKNKRLPSTDSNLAAYILRRLLILFVQDSLFKVYQGVFPSTGTVYNSSKELDERGNGLSYLIGKKQIPADSGIVVSDIGSVTNWATVRPMIRCVSAVIR